MLTNSLNIKKLLKNRVFLRLIFIVIFSTLFFVFLKYYYSHLLYLDLADEDDNFLLGQMILEGKKLYVDIFSHHQPLVYLMSSLIQFFAKPSSIFLLIKRHREFMIDWSYLWGVVMIIRFGFRGLLFSSFYEYSKMLNFGHMFISEALIFYPLGFLTMELFENIKKAAWYVIWLAGIVWFIAFHYIMLWPILAIYSFFFLYKLRLSKVLVLVFIVVLLVLTIVLIPFISIPEYFYNTVYINGAYYAKLMANSVNLFSLAKSFFLPISNFIEENTSAMGIIFRLLFGVLIITFVLMYERKRKISLLLITVLGLLTLASLRYIPIGLQEYYGFHTLPYYALVLAFMIQISTRFLARKEKYSFLIVTVLLIIVSLTIYKKNFLFHDHNLEGDYYYHFSKIVDLGEAVRIMKDNTDRLFVCEINQLVYWHSRVKQFSRYTYYYRWMDKTPPIKQEISKKFENDLPEFFIFTLRTDKENIFLKKYMNKYVQVLKDDFPVDLYVRFDKAVSLTKQQLKDLSYYNITFDYDRRWCEECAKKDLFNPI